MSRPKVSDEDRKSTIIHVRLDQADIDYLNHWTGGRTGQRSKVIRKLLHAVNPAILAD
jgi:hypothetical protein